MKVFLQETVRCIFKCYTNLPESSIGLCVDKKRCSKYASTPRKCKNPVYEKHRFAGPTVAVHKKKLKISCIEPKTYMVTTTEFRID